MSMERGGFGNVARSASFVERVCLTAVCARDCWAGAAAAAAGCGLLGSTDLLASALRTSVAMVGLFDIEVMKKDQVVLCAAPIGSRMFPKSRFSQAVSEPVLTASSRRAFAAACFQEQASNTLDALVALELLHLSMQALRRIAHASTGGPIDLSSSLTATSASCPSSRTVPVYHEARAARARRRSASRSMLARSSRCPPGVAARPRGIAASRGEAGRS